MSRQAYPTRLRDHLGNEVHLPPKPFAVGGEGAVFDVLGKPDLVAKLYSRPQSKERCDKLRAMAKLCRPELLKIAAWPTATLSDGNPATIVGFLMPRIANHLEIHNLYSVAQRKKDFPEADWGFLLHTARNCAIAFEAVHDHGHVVGDVNQKNVMVSKKGIVSLVDCDSFQVSEGTHIFRCGVGVDEYTPPDLQGKNFASLDRAANHDLFGLAVLIFQLLMLGRHPFSGVPLVKADIPIVKAIQDGLYAYTRNPTKLKPPPNTPPLTMLDAATRDLFERAFGSTRRPTATEWRDVLDALMKQLARCKNDPKHSFPASAGECPWCRLIAAARLMFFLPGRGATAAAFRPEDIQKFINNLAGMQLPFPTYVRPRAILPIRVVLPAGLQSVKKPHLRTHPASPAPIQKPALAPSPPPPVLIFKPTLKPPPGQPIIPPMPAIKPYPSAPIAPPLPKLHALPPPSDYPPLPTLGPSDPFLSRLCVAGFIGGLFVILVARPVGMLVMAAFAIWWFILNVTEHHRREMARKSQKADHASECARLDEEYAEICQPIETANKRIADAWRAANNEMVAQYQQICWAVDEENRRKLAPWEATKAEMETQHARACGEIERANLRDLSAWEAENASRQAAYNRARADIEMKNQQLLSAWEALTSSRQAEHDRRCGEIDAANRRLIADWETANAPWLAEVQRWRDRVVMAEAEVGRLEAELHAQRLASEARFRQIKDQAKVIVASHDCAKNDYERDLRQAEVDSKRIQLDEHLDKALIRSAKLKGITGERILSLESFGIATAKDVPMLNHQKVPGIGPVLSSRMFAWRDSLALSFVPKQTLPESEKNRIAGRYAPVLMPLSQSIQDAIRELDVVVVSQRAGEGELLKAIGAAVQGLALAEAHVKAMKVA